jgi:PAS domain S-box-containing protein
MPVVTMRKDIDATSVAAAGAFEDIEQRYRCLLDMAGVVVICMDCDGHIIEWSRSAETIYGYRRDEVLGKNYAQMFLPEQVRDAVARDFQAVLGGKTTEGFENPVHLRGGGWCTVRWNVTCLVGADGRVAGVWPSVRT